MKCKHEKVYSSRVLYTNPLQYSWVCKKCGETGRDQSESFQYDEYEEAWKKSHNEEEFKRLGGQH